MTNTTESIFTKIIRREIPAQIVYETDQVIAFKDVSPRAPTHLLIVPKKPLKNISDASEEDRLLLGDLFLAANKIASQLGLDQSGYRLVVNNGASAGQTVWHLHMHLMAGRNFEWPPG